MARRYSLSKLGYDSVKSPCKTKGMLKELVGMSLKIVFKMMMMMHLLSMRN